MNIYSFLVPVPVAIVSGFALFGGMYYLIGGFHDGWYASEGHRNLLAIPFAIGILLFFFSKQERWLVTGSFITLALFVGVALTYDTDLFPMEVVFVLYHTVIASGTVLAAGWARNRLFD